MNAIGLVVVHSYGARSEQSLRKRIQVGAAITPIGRVLAVTYQMPKHWEPSLSVEGLATSTVLDPAGSRGDEDDWEFSGNLAVRVCEVKKGVRCVTSEIGVILFRRSGDKPYVRRRSMTEEQINSARLDSLHPVFTRDIANNIWHLEKSEHLTTLTNRLGALLAWPDEMIAVVRGRTSLIAVSQLDLERNIIGVPTKVDYPWALPVLEFGSMN